MALFRFLITKGKCHLTVVFSASRGCVLHCQLHAGVFSWVNFGRSLILLVIQALTFKIKIVVLHILSQESLQIEGKITEFQIYLVIYVGLLMTTDDLNN